MIGTQVGPWWSGPRARCGLLVGPRETMTQRAVSTGSYTSACTLHPSGTITLTIVK